MKPHNMGSAVCVRETEKAICCQVDILDEDVWIPKSQVHDDSEVWENAGEGDLIVSEWFAEKQGWA